MGLFFYILLNFFGDKLVYSENFKFIYLLITILLSLMCYLVISVLTKAFKLSDINLNYK